MTQQLTRQEQIDAIKTWRYLRMAMVGLVVGLIAAIAYQHGKGPGCFLTSISAYYYTPVQGYFVGALVGIGLCLFCLKGSTDAEDILLNFAGIFAMVVALVPTPHPGTCPPVLDTIRDRDANVANNMTALFVVGAAALLVLAIFAWRNRPPRLALIGYFAAAGAGVAAALVFWLARHTFVEDAHNVAASLMFACIIVVVGINALGYKAKTEASSVRNRYAAIAVAMIASAVGIGIAGCLGWAYWLIWLEGALIFLFAIFWSIQTIELWHDGLR